MTTANDQPPTMYVLAGPNGAGKSTLYETRLRQLHPDVEFVNADRLAFAALGRHAESLPDAQLGQQLANERRDALMGERKSFITESTFSHESKLALIREAKDAGYRVQLYHVNVRSADISVGRVENRVEHGGHDVPENKIRERYERNQPLIRQAALESDHAYVFDNSRQDKAPRLVVGMEHGRVRMVGENVPTWAMRLYATELQRFPKERLNPLAASYAIAQQKTTAELGDSATTYPARVGGTYRGTILATTAHHTLQQVGRTSAIAHITERLVTAPQLGAQVTIAYDSRNKSKASVQEPHRAVDPTAREHARLLREAPRDIALKQAPSLKLAYDLVDAAVNAIPKNQEGTRRQVADAVRDRLAIGIERGIKLPELGRVQETPKRTTAPARKTPERDRER